MYYNEDFEIFKKRRAIQEGPENFKMVVVAIIILSTIIFNSLSKQQAKDAIWYWASGMVVLLVVAVALDIRAHLKIKKLVAHYKRSNSNGR